MAGVTKAPLRVAVLISGRGSNLRALLEACAEPGFPARIVLVIANRPDAAGLVVARQHGIATQVIEHRGFARRQDFDDALDRALSEAAAELVCLAGFMRILGAGFVRRWRDRLINIHPSLLPAFPGLDTHARALAAGVRVAGCSVHFVRAETDNGPIIIQAAVAVTPSDTPETLAARVLAEEHRCYRAALRWIAEGRVRVVDERVSIDRAEFPPSALVSPRDGVPGG